MTPERHPQADEAARYVFGQLSPKARHEFEVQLTQSAELRLLVQELEEGLEAMARAVPQRRPPPQTWAPIEEAIAREAQRKVVTPLWANWWRSGWAAAAACLIAFSSYAWWMQRHQNPPATPPATGVELAVGTPQAELTPVQPAPVRLDAGRPTNKVITVIPKPPAEATSLELASLRWQITALKSQLENLSEVVSQQKAILTEPGRFKFFLPASVPAGTDEATAPALSPGLQRAITYAMARDLGWLPRPSQTTTPNDNARAAAVTTISGIDFVEFNQSQNTALAASAGTQVQSEETDAPTKAAPVTVRRGSGNIPGYFQNDPGNEAVVFAIDPTIVSRGSMVEMWGTSATGSLLLIGRALTGDNPMVLRMPTEGISGDLTITASQTSGTSVPIGQFSIVPDPQPESQPNPSP